MVEFTPRVDSGFLCDGKWHKVKATKYHLLLTLNVDGDIQSNPRNNISNQKIADTSVPLYIGGYPGKQTVFVLNCQLNSGYTA